MVRNSYEFCDSRPSGLPGLTPFACCLGLTPPYSSRGVLVRDHDLSSAIVWPEPVAGNGQFGLAGARGSSIIILFQLLAGRAEAPRPTGSEGANGRQNKL